MKRHTKTGEEIEIKDLTNGHLSSIYKMIKKMEVEGRTIQYGGGTDAEDMRYEEELVKGEELYETFPIYREIVIEYDRRFNSDSLDFLHHNGHEVKYYI